MTNKDDRRTHQPKGSMCCSCGKRSEDCSLLPFELMPVISRASDGVMIVKCSDYKQGSVMSHTPTIEDAIAAADGTLHGAIDYWQNQCAALKQQNDELQAKCDGLATIKSLCDLKFTSGNCVPVERITITRAEYEAIANAQGGGE